MTSIPRIIPVSLSLVLTMTLMAVSAAAQTSLFEIESSAGAKLIEVGDDGGFVVKGATDAGTVPATGAGARLMWYPRRAALRAGFVTSDGWDDQNVGVFSMALGADAIASGIRSTALGAITTASGESSTAMGARTLASGNTSTAMGQGTKAVGNYSTAMGLGTSATGGSSTALGSGATASADFSTAMGVATTASGNSSTAMGYGTIASADYATSMGIDTRASGVSSTAIGAASNAAGLASVAMGTRAIAQGDGSFAFADRSSTETYTAGANQFVVRAHGGIGFNSGTNIGCDLPAGEGGWACTSSRLAKEGFASVDGEAVLAKLADIPIQRWYYLGSPVAHVGPTAEDFHGAFGLGEGPTTITTIDADGVALLGVQTLERRTAELRAENAELRTAIATLLAGQVEVLRRLEGLESGRADSGR